MDKKPQKSWTDAQMTIAAIAITATLGMWNLFSIPQKQQVMQATDTATPPPPPPPTEVVVTTATQLPQFVPVKIIFGGLAPKQQVIVQASAQQPAHKKPSGGKTPNTGTGSSKP
jgi:cytochrome oxidase assembly protein ShyY1